MDIWSGDVEARLPGGRWETSVGHRIKFILWVYKYHTMPSLWSRSVNLTLPKWWLWGKSWGPYPGNRMTEQSKCQYTTLMHSLSCSEPVKNACSDHGTGADVIVKVLKEVEEKTWCTKSARCAAVIFSAWHHGNRLSCCNWQPWMI